MIDYSDYFDKWKNSINLEKYIVSSSKYALHYHFNQKNDWGNLVIDFGGRIGEKTRLLKNVVVVEKDKSALNWMNKNNINAITPEELETSYSNKNKVDLIYISHVLEHFSEPLQLLKQFYSYLSANGTLIVVLPSEFPIMRPQRKEKDGGGDEHLFLWNLTEIKNILKEAKFNVIFSEFNPVHIRVANIFRVFRKTALWKLLWILYNNLRWWKNLLFFYLFDKAKLSTAGEIIIYAKKESA